MASLTEQEIYAQPEAWAGALETVKQQRDAVRGVMQGAVLFCGCGTSYYIAIAAARTYQEVTGLPARAVPGSELFLAPAAMIPAGQRGPLVAISRSGETSETVIAARVYKEHGYGPVVALTARSESALGQVADLTLALPWADDQSVVMTRSFTTLLLAAWAMAAAVADDQAYQAELERLPALAEEALAAAAPLAQELGRNLSLSQFVFLGLSAHYGIAQEGMLKLKEMTQVASEAFSPLEFRHGPISVVNAQTAVVLLADGRGAGYYGSLLSDIGGFGGTRVVVGSPLDGLPSDRSLPLGQELSDQSRGLLYLPFLQLLGLNRALALGRNPDLPQHLNRVVML